MRILEKKRIQAWALALGLLLCCGTLPAEAAEAPEEAHEIEIAVSGIGGRAASRASDGSYHTTAALSPDTPLTIEPQEGEGQIFGLYVAWYERPESWSIRCDGGAEVPCGEHGFLHEYVPVEGGADSVTLTVSAEEKLCWVKAYSAGELPPDVQVWEPECGQADFLLFSTHADDEILFLGGIQPEYAGERGLGVEVVYFSNYFGSGEPYREHEKLDGLWTCGVRNYPVNAPFHDEYTNDMEDAKRVYSYDAAMEFLIEQLRRFKPLICVAQDVKGEYGHGTHIFTSAVTREAVTVSMDPEVYPASAAEYGVWDVPKTYIHLYKEGAITLETRRPLGAFGGKTCLEVAKEAYKQHVSQQKWSFRVDDEYKYSMARFGLYRTTVGEDTGNDMMEHLVSWEEQARLEAERLAREEAERLAREEAERKAKEEEERLAREEADRLAREEAERQAAQEAAEAAAAAKAEAEAAQAAAEQAQRERARTLAIICGAVVAGAATAAIVWFIVTVRRREHR